MESMNKFKVLTIIILCMFFFVVAAIYTNTKEASADKIKTKSNTIKETVNRESDSDLYDNSQFAQLAEKYDILSERIDDLNARYNESESNTKLKCRIYGTITDETPEALSADVALQDAKINNNDILIRCSLK